MGFLPIMVSGTFLAYWSTYRPFDQVIHYSEATDWFLN